MRIAKISLMALLGLLPTLAFCQIKSVTLNAPTGFEGPVSATHQGAKVEAYVKKIEGSERGTLLQVSSYDFGAQLEGLPPERRAEAASFYLSEFLSGIERARTSFHASAIQEVSLDNLPAARVEWKGVGYGTDMQGIMYCVIVGTEAISFHVQVLEGSPPEDKEAALKAVESVKLNI